MTDPERPRNLARRETWAGLALASLLIAGLITWPWLSLLLASVPFPRLAVGLLAAVEILYSMIVTLILAGLAVLLARVPWGRTGANRRGIAVRALTAVFAGLLAVGTAEFAAAGWLAWDAWSTARSLARSGLTREVTLPRDFPEPSPPGEINLVVLGESSAVGFPCHEWLNLGKIVVRELGRAIPSRRFHLELLAHEGDTLELQHRRLAGLRRRPDAIVVYCGHNEFAARYGPNHAAPHYIDRQAAGPRFLLEPGLARWSPFCRLLRRAADRHRVGLLPATGTRRPVVDAPVFTAREFAERVADFHGRLDRIVVHARQVGALPILVIPPGNDADFEPNRSYLPPGTTAAERDAIARKLLAIRRDEETDPAGCMRRYRAMLSRQPGFAEAHFRLARLLEREGQWGEAYEHYLSARDLDGLPVRCPTALQDVYREVAARHDAVLVDGQAVFHEAGTHGLLDDRLFHDAMHPSVRGHVLLAEAVLKALHARRAFGWAADAPPPALDPATTAARFGIDAGAWKLLCERAAMFYYGFLGARYEAGERAEKQRTYLEAARRIAAGADPGSLGLPNIGVAGDNQSGGSGTTARRDPSPGRAGSPDRSFRGENVRK